MKLTKLELSGFKSFADTVTLDFGHGVTAIVGPNGCGKSNVSDAVRWVLGEQSARLLRGGKMEDVIFQGSSQRRPVNVTEVSLFLDNSDGDLPIAYKEVVITRRLSRSGQSDYLLNKSPVRLRDIHDLIRGTGLGSDAGVVIEAKAIDRLLSDRADERRSLFEEAAGIGLYRDRKHSTERRLEETGQDLQRVEDLIAEVQSQLRSLARQKGKAERHAKLMEEKFAVQLTLARRQLDGIDQRLAHHGERREALATDLPAAREALATAEHTREEAARARASVEAERTEIVRRLGAVRVELGRLDGDLNLAAERLANAATRKVRAAEERNTLEQRRAHAGREREAAVEERTAAVAEHGRIQQELLARTQAEQAVRDQLAEARQRVRQLEEEVQQGVTALKSLEGERTALERDLQTLREQASHHAGRQAQLAAELAAAERRRDETVEGAERAAEAGRVAAQRAEQARHEVAEARRREALERAERRTAEETLAQVSARRQALVELERDRVGLAPGAAALLAVRERFGDAVLGPLSDFITTSREDADLAERLLGDWLHAVLVRDRAAVSAILAWHQEAQAGALVLLPVFPGPAGAAGRPIGHGLQVLEPATAWVQALVAGSEVLDPAGRALQRPNGAVYLSTGQAQQGPLRRRADLESLTGDLAAAETRLQRADAALAATVGQLAALEQGLEQATQDAERAREAERQAVAHREDAVRVLGTVGRDLAESERQVGVTAERLARAEGRLAEIDRALTEGDLGRVKQEERLAEARAHLTRLDGDQETAREARVHWQVQEAQVAARLQAATERLERAERTSQEAEALLQALAEELGRLDADIHALDAQRAEWGELRAEKRIALLELEAAASDVEIGAGEAEAALTVAEQALNAGRHAVEAMTEEHHTLALEATELTARRRSIVERIEADWRKPVDQLLGEAPVLDLDEESLENESARIVDQLEQIGPVNALAFEEHAEETKRLEFLITQRDDLVAGRQSLQQAIREIDGTARTMFLETFEAIRLNFHKVFQTLFGGGECELRLAQPDEPLESEIEIHAAPRGKRTQRIHLLSSGERTLVATSLLFAIYLTKPSPFCLMDEVDAPLDDANVGRFTRLLDEFKAGTQFIVITHNPRTMQSADAVYGVTMQEPGVSTIVGVRLGENVAA
ncbi:MAG TPA: AAA family ATPase [Gemmatimonadales bacterium]|nr:AAA family ATPase [Gemmatimonadales bacterium]